MSGNGILSRDEVERIAVKWTGNLPREASNDITELVGTALALMDAHKVDNEMEDDCPRCGPVGIVEGVLCIVCDMEVEAQANGMTL